jgi:DNA-binding transcriptional LysR family regulator
MLPSSFDDVTELGLSPLNRLAAASPDYLQVNGVPHHPTDLTRHRLLNFQPIGSTWVFEGAHGPINIEIAPHLSTNDGHVLLDAAIAGNGIALFASYMASAALKSNELQLVLQEFPVPQFWIRALVPNNRLHLPRVQVFLSFLKDAFGEDVWNALECTSETGKAL